MAQLSRLPEDYRPDPSGHFRRRFQERDIPPVVIQKAIEGGDPTEQENGRIKLETQYLGYTFYVVVDPDEKHVITAFSPDDWH